MKPDPPLRPDGLCAVCHGDRTPKKGLSGITGVLARAVAISAQLDPFCSATCARKWHEQEDRTPLGRPPKLPKYHGHDRRKYRLENRVPCEGGCGKQVEGKGRGTHPGGDPNRPHLCVQCSNRAVAARKRKAAA